MDLVPWRRDTRDLGANSTHVIWGFRLPKGDREIKEGLVMLYSLVGVADQPPVLCAPGATHEFTVYEVDPGTRIDFAKSLFEQKCVSPLTPGIVGYQFEAHSSEEAMDRLGAVVRRIVDLELEPSDPGAWGPFFTDATLVPDKHLDISSET